MDTLSIWSDLSKRWVLIAFATFILYLICDAIYNLYFSPLAKFPGPFLAKISSLPNFYHACTGYRHIWIWQCHQVYGDAFRFRPNGVLFMSPKAYNGIYGAKGNNVKKSEFYTSMQRSKHFNSTITSTDKAIHAKKRKVLNSVFSDKTVQSAEAFIIKHVDKWCEAAGEQLTAWTGAKNVSPLVDFLTFDIMGDLAFGVEFRTQEPGENPMKAIPGTIHSFLKRLNMIGHSPLLHVWVWLKPRGLDILLQATAPKNVVDYFKFVGKHVKERIHQEDLIASNGERDEKVVRHDLFHSLYASKNPETGKSSFTHTQLSSEASLLVIAGADTTAAAMSAILYHLTRNERVYNKLVDEIRSTFDSVDEIRGGAKLNSCHYLRACISEALRINPSGLTEPPREVLKGGLVIDGKFVPEGTTVGCAAWATFHSEECYGDPWVYRPERWIIDPETGVTGEDVAKAHSSFHPFLIGTGNCVGQKIAMLELLVFVGRTLWRMDVRNADGVGEKKDLGWGRRHKNVLEVRDAYVTLHDGPMVQFRNRSV